MKKLHVIGWREKVKLPARKEGKKYDDHATLKGRRFVEQKY